MDPLTATPRVLNDDIFEEIAAFCDRPTLSCLSRTCRKFHPRGTRLLLKRIAVVCQASSLESLCQFLRADNFYRVRYLRGLALHVGEVPLDVASLLVEVLGRSTHLETLALTEAEILLKSHHPAIADAVANLTTLRNLCVRGAETFSRNMVLAVQSPVAEFDLDYYIPPDGSQPSFDDLLEGQDIRDYHPLYVAQRFAPTLGCLHSYYSTRPSGVQVHPGLPVYPNLSCLLLHDDWPFLRNWIAGCPNVRDLRFMTALELAEDNLYPEGTGPVDPTWDELRLANLEDQRAHGSWAHLRETCGEALGLYILGLTCHIPVVKITREVRPNRFEMLGAVLAEARPKSLRVDLRADYETLVDPQRGVASVLRATAASLEALVLGLRVQHGSLPRRADRSPDFQPLLLNVLWPIQSDFSALASLRLYIKVEPYVDTDLDSDSDSDVDSDLDSDTDLHTGPDLDHAHAPSRARRGDVPEPDAVEVSGDDLSFIRHFARTAVDTSEKLSEVEIALIPPSGDGNGGRFVRVVRTEGDARMEVSVGSVVY